MDFQLNQIVQKYKTCIQVNKTSIMCDDELKNNLKNLLKSNNFQVSTPTNIHELEINKKIFIFNTRKNESTTC